MSYYITTPIYYVNSDPHFGHAYTTVMCDVLARYKRLNGENVKFLTGTDEHGQKVAQSAIKFGVEPQVFVDQVSLLFRNMMDALNISYSDFIRTTEDRHKRGASALWRELFERGFIYFGTYSGWYSVRDETFYNESELTQEGLAPTGAAVEWIEEPSYFFRLSSMQEKLIKFYEENPNFVKPGYRYNEVKSFVKMGLGDLSISRSKLKWGIPIPNDETHVMYVWLDALTNYISALGYPNLDGDYATFWPASAHIVGKEILRFHAVYWPAFLMAAEIKVPQQIFAHGWWLVEGEKMSKSVGNVINPLVLINDFGVDYVRYFLCREIIFGNDGNYSRSSFINHINAELVNKIGNLVQRTLSLVHKNFGGVVPYDNFDKEEILEFAHNIVVSYCKAMDNMDISHAISYIVSLAEEANSYIDKHAPWRLPVGNDMKRVLYTLLEVIRHIGILLQPIIPDSACKILDFLSVPREERTFKYSGINGALKTCQLPNFYIIFPRIQ